MKPNAERDSKLFQQGEKDIDEEYHQVMSKLQSFLTNETDDIIIPCFEPKKIDAKTIDFNDPYQYNYAPEPFDHKLLQLLQESYNKYSTLRNQCYIKMKNKIGIDQLKNNEELRVLIIIPSRLQERRILKDTETPKDKQTHEISYQHQFIENYEDIAIAFFLRHMFHFQYMIDYKNILITSSEDDNFKIFNISSGFMKFELDKSSSKPYLSFNSKMESNPLSSDLIIQFNVPPSMLSMQHDLLVQVLDNLITFQYDGLIKYNVSPFNEYSFKQLNSNKDCNLLVFIIDHGTYRGFGDHHSFDYYIKGIEKIEAKNYFFFVDSCDSASLIDLFKLPEQMLKQFNNFDCLLQKYTANQINKTKLLTSIFKTIFETQKNIIKQNNKKDSKQQSIPTLQIILQQLQKLKFTQEEKDQITILLKEYPSFFNSKLFKTICDFELFSDLEVFQRFSNTKNFKVFASSYRKSFSTFCYAPKTQLGDSFLKNFFGTFYMSIIIQILFFDHPSSFTESNFIQKIQYYSKFLKENFQDKAHQYFGENKFERSEIDAFFEQLGDEKLMYSNSISKSNFWFQPYITKVNHAIEKQHIPYDSYLPIPNDFIVQPSKSKSKSKGKQFILYFQDNANKLLHSNGYTEEFDALNLNAVNHPDEYLWRSNFKSSLPYFPDRPWSRLVDFASVATANYILDNNLEDELYSVICIISNAFALTKKQHPNVNSFTYLCE